MPTDGTAGARPSRLDAYARALAEASGALEAALTGLVGQVEAWNRRPSDVGGRIDVDRVRAVARASAELAALDRWVGRVGAAFRSADGQHGTGVLPARVFMDRPGGPASSMRCEVVAPWAVRRRFQVVRDGADGRARVIRLALDRPPGELSVEQWRLAVEELRLAGGGGPLHVVVHGWGTTTGGATGAGEAKADLYDGQRVEGATVLVVDWDAGGGTDAGWWRVPGDFEAAEVSAHTTGDALAGVLTAVAAADPDVEVAVSAHSLGNHVAARALSQMEDPSARFSVDYLALQPAIPAWGPVADPAGYGALADSRVRQLTVTINEGDDALFWYEAQGPEALGDEPSDGAGLRALLARRAAAHLPTEVVDHDSAAGGGHLGLRPGDAQPLVRALVQLQVDRAHAAATGG
ncbi:MAG TPA: alpha/beta hydrolase [Acidimicrobiales bacterium]|nr:alpha/beta hydrolase [Acidimicrobiales bacterium]